MVLKADIMAVGAHPDDTEFAIGGTVAHWVRAGKSVVYVVCTSGEKGTSDRTMKPEVLAPIREAEQRAAARLLGVKDVVFLGYPDQGLEDTPQFRKDIVRQIRRYRPDIVLTSDPYFKYVRHRDHRISGQVTMDAVFPYARDHLAYPDLISEGLEPHKVSEVWTFGTEDPNYRESIGDVWDIKLAALRCHRSQVGDISPQMLERLTQRARDMAKGEQFELAEAFHRVQITY